MKPFAVLDNRSLSTKLLLLTIVFVFLAEIVVLIPSVSKQRIDWFEARIEAAYLVVLALEGPREEMMDEDVARQLFSTAHILGVTVNRDNTRMLILAPEIDPHGPPHMHRVDLREQIPTTMIANGWGTMFSTGDDLIQVTGAPRYAAEQAVDIIVSQRALRQDLLVYARNILGLSLVISSLTAALVYWALNRMIVRPVERLTKDMASFEADPDQAALIHIPSERQDEIGAAEQSLAAMQRRIHDLLNERRRLAALGAGISKISHDLRNILASAQLMSDRLAKSDDPQVRKLSPRLISALDRAIVLSRNTLTFARMEENVLSKSPLNLHELVAEVFEDTAAMGVTTYNKVAGDLSINADRTQFYRSLFNLIRNSVEALTPNGAIDAEHSQEQDQPLGAITIAAQQIDDVVVITIADTGPGMPEHARSALFEPFKGSKKPGGSGLGVAISAEIIRAHGGMLTLVRSDASGTVFEITIPHTQEN
jgi:signal transduction histidine kinase